MSVIDRFSVPLSGSVAEVPVVVVALGDSAIQLEVVDGDVDLAWRATLAVRQTLLADRPTGMTEVISTFRHVLVAFDALRTDPEQLSVAMQERLSRAVASRDLDVARHFVVPTVFGGAHGPDLDEVAQLVGLTSEAFVASLLEETFTIRFIGAGMEPMSTGTTVRSLPRRTIPRAAVPAGSVSMAAASLSIYPFVSPGGWQLVGRTPFVLCDIEQDPPVAYRPGDTLSLSVLDPDDWHTFDGRLLQPEADPEVSR